MNKSDFENFGVLMLTWGETSIGSEKDKNPSDEKIFLYFCALSDMEFDDIRNNAMLHFNNSDWFPGVSSLRNPLPLKDRAIIDFETIRKVINKSHDVDNIKLRAKIKSNLKELGRSDLEDILFNFINDFDTTKLPIIRSQFIRYYQASVHKEELKLIESSQQNYLDFKPKQLNNKTTDV